MMQQPWATFVAWLRKAARTLARRLEASIIAEAPHRRIFGIPVIDRSLTSEEDSESHFEVVQEALTWISKCDPQRIDRIKSGVDQIHVDDLPGRKGEYQHKWNAAVVATGTIGEGPKEVALNIIHESTHGRLMKAGFGYPEERRRQIERICNKRVLSFLQIAEPEGDRIAELQSSLARPGLDNLELWLSDREKKVARLERMGLPNWFMKPLRNWDLAQRRRVIERYRAQTASDENDA